MNIFDISVIIALIASFIYSMFKGLIGELFSLLAIILGFMGAGRVYPFGVKVINTFIHNQFISKMISLLIIIIAFILFIFIINQLGKLVRFSMELIKLLWLDRVGGALCGIAKVIVIACIISSFLIYFLPAHNKILRSSRLLPYFVSLNTTIGLLIPPHIKDIYNNKLEELKNFWEKQKLYQKLRKFPKKAGSFPCMTGRACLADFN